MMKRTMMVAAAGMVAMAVAACGDGPSRPTGVNLAEVAGIYAVCSLDFEPENDLLRSVDIVQDGFETENPDVRRPQLQIDTNGDFQLLFTPKGQFVERTFIGRTSVFSGNRLVMEFTGGSAAATSYLLPTRLEVSFQETPKSLTTAQTLRYEVARADYARMAAADESGLAERIPGRLQVVFQSIATGCG